jgi:capsular exopolysaccharide synthesis family protein
MNAPGYGNSEVHLVHRAAGALPAPEPGALPRPNGEVRQPEVTSLDYTSGEGMLPSALAPPFSMGRLLKALRHRWLLALTVGLTLGGGAAAAVWFLRPAEYTAYAILHVAPLEPRLFPEQDRGDAARDNFQRDQVEMIHSKKVLFAALDKHPELRDTSLLKDQIDPLEWLEKELKVHFLEGANFVRIALSGMNPVELPKIVNAVKDSYVEESSKFNKNPRRELLKELTQICDRTEQDLGESRERLQQLAKAQQSVNPATAELQRKLAYDKYAAYSRQLSEVQTKLDIALMQLQMDKEEPAPSMAQVSREVEADPLVSKARSKILDLDEEINTTKAKLQEGQESAVLRALLMRREEARKDLERFRKDQRVEVEARQREQTRDERRIRTKSTELMARHLKQQLDDWTKKTEAAAKQAEASSTPSYRLEVMQGEVDQASKVLAYLRTEEKKLEVELKAKIERVTSWQPAEVPGVPDTYKRIRMVAAAGSCAFLLGLLGVSFWELRSNKISDREEIVGALGMRVVGSLPVTATGSPARRLGRRDPSHLLHESADSIRTMLLCDHAGPAPRVVMITSACSREGKTTLATHLATSAARIGKRTLLIDGDMRRPVLHRLINVPLKPGLSNVLIGEINASDAVLPVGESCLWLLPAGDKVRPALARLAQDAMRGLLKELRSDYDFIVVDCCPVLAVADALMMGRGTDGVVLSVRPHLSRLPQVHAAIERLAAVGIQVIGTVVNGEHCAAYHDQSYYQYQADLEKHSP